MLWPQTAKLCRNFVKLQGGGSGGGGDWGGSGGMMGAKDGRD